MIMNYSVVCVFPRPIELKLLQFSLDDSLLCILQFLQELEQLRLQI
jgi:hypothetical protein